MLLWVFAAIALGTNGAPPEAELTWHEVTSNDVAMQSIPLRIYATLPGMGRLAQSTGKKIIQGKARRSLGKVPAGYSAPSGVYEPSFFSTYKVLGNSLVGLAASSSKSGPIDRIWIDWNGDKRFSLSELAKLSPRKDSRWKSADTFVYEELPRGKLGPIHLELLLLNKTAVAFMPTGYMAGSITIAGRQTKVAVVDSNFDGGYGSEAKGAPSDTLILGVEGVSLPALLQLGDGNFWEPKVSPNGSKILFVQDGNPKGVLEFAGAELRSCSSESQGRTVVVKAEGNRLTLPAGAYTIVGASFTLADGAGKKWFYAVGGSVQPLVQVGAASVKTVRVGNPLVLGMKVEAAAGAHWFTLSLTDASGAAVQALSNLNGNNPPAPKLVIKDPEGKIIKVLTFAFG